MLDRRSKAIVKLLLLLIALVETITAHAQSQWIRDDHNNNHGVIVFVHAVTGDATSTWTASNRSYWPDLLTRDRAFDDKDIFVYEYKSPKLTSAPSINDLADNLRMTLASNEVLRHDQLIFVCHSFGDIVTRAYILRYRDQDQLAKKIRLIYFFATPTTGSEIAKLGHLSANPQIVAMLPMSGSGGR